MGGKPNPIVRERNKQPTVFNDVPFPDDHKWTSFEKLYLSMLDSFPYPESDQIHDCICEWISNCLDKTKR